MDILWIISIILFGTAIGSFLNVCIYRIPEGKSIIRPASHCPRCENKVRPRDNIPVLSFLILRGRCRFCREKISLQYPVVEIITPILLVFNFLYFKGLPTFSFLLHFSFSSILVILLIVIFFIDLHHRIIPDRITYPGIILGILYNLLQLQILPSIIGILGGGGFLYLVMTLGRWIYKKEVMGGGDVKLAAMIGSFLGGSDVALTLFLAFFIGSLVGGFLILFGRLNRASFVPFGPFIVAGALLTLFYQEELLSIYSRLFLRM
jgi:leader peptidase (prepilin peptidase)/N-methyltransferase